MIFIVLAFFILFCGTFARRYALPCLTFLHEARSSQPHGLKALFNLAVDAEESGVINFLVDSSVERDVI